MQEIEMEVEEDADTEREDLKAREARRKVLISLQMLCIQICMYVLLSILVKTRLRHIQSINCF